MTLRRKILLGYLIFIAIFVAANAWSAWRIHAMADLSRRIIADNYDSVVAAEQMKETLERQDSAAAFILLGQRDRAVSQLRENREKFDAAFAQAAGNITEPGEPDRISAIRTERDAYYALVDAFVVRAGRDASATDSADLRTEYFEKLVPEFNRLRQKSQELLDLNQTAMRAKSNAAETVARRWFVSTVAADVLLLLVAAFLAYHWSAILVRPLKQLRSTTKQIAGGDLDARVDLRSHDEVGLLGAEFNRMAERIRQLRRTDLGQVVLAQQTTEAAIHSLSDPVVVTDSEGRITKLNYAAELLFGSPSERLGKPIAEVAGDRRVAEAVAVTLRSQRPVELAGAAAVELPDQGTKHTFHLRATPMRDQDDHLLGAVALLEDITEARQRDRARSDFINSATDHLRGPLVNVELGLHTLLDGRTGELTEKQVDILENCRADCTRLDHLLKDLVELSHIEAGEEPPRPVRFDPAQLLAQVESPLRAQAAAKRVALIVSPAPDLPIIRADRPQIERVLHELCENALRHVSPGGEIGLSAILRDGEIVFDVSNTGEPIPKEFLPRIFERFIKIPGTVAGQTGLGLSLAKNLVEQNGGKIQVVSEAGRGTSFTFTIPIRD